MASTIQNFASQYSFYANLITTSTAIFGNILNLLIFTKLKIFRDNRCIFYLTIESISNLINQLFTLIINILPKIYGYDITSYSLTWCRIKNMIYQIANLITLSMVCFAAVDQFFSTNYRLHLRQLCTFKLAQCFVFASIFIWFMHSLLYSFYTAVNPSFGCILSNQIWIAYTTYFFFPVIAGFLPILTASLFSLLAYGNVRRIIRRQVTIERRRFDRQITAMILIRVILFVIVTFPYTCYKIYSNNISSKNVDALRAAIERLIQVFIYSFCNLNYAVNFYLFFISSSRYRRQVKYVLKKKYWRQIINWCCHNENQIQPENTLVSDENIVDE
ncbi:unnamed protein product [Adineta steineri]|uniref:G-protein coupled receptors family 1 profile domain-containing protein n=3 Tax=Adineta steineri TaxID=433720 RepID=A0A814DJ91_9BILA|nr:unnamed protein product [Adineta steineri]